MMPTQTHEHNWFINNQCDDSVVVVGNGASLLNAGKGVYIDQHDVVVRFNLFKISKFENDVGTKTSIWFNNRGAESIQVKNLLKQYQFSEIFIHTWYNTGQAVQTFNDELTKLGRYTPVTEIDKKMLVSMRLFLGEDYSCFSTGAIGVWMLLGQYKRLSLIGFDWWNYPEKFHYADNGRFEYNPNSGHQPHLEKAFYDKLVKLQRVVLH